MENHPIPQDVTGFQFKLIGNMTIKQFAYLACGVFLAWLTYVSPFTAFIKLPLAIIFGFVGAALAFFPIEGRPMDVMIIHFLKALFNPNQYVFQKEHMHFTQAYNLSQPNQLHTEQFQQVAATPPPVTVAEPPKETAPAPEKPSETPQLEVITQPAEPAPQPVEQQQSAQYDSLVQELEKSRMEKEAIEKELLQLKEILTQQKSQQETLSPAPIEPPPPPKVATQAIVKTVPARTAKTPGVPIPDSPNILTGIIKNPRGNCMPNILVEVKDTDGNPVRAFKTNQLGQFASATPLLNGVYHLEFEDPQGAQKFDALELTMTGEIINPIEVTSIDQREELRQALFPSN